MLAEPELGPVAGELKAIRKWVHQGGTFILVAKVIDVTTGRNLRANRIEAASLREMIARNAPEQLPFALGLGFEAAPSPLRCIAQGWCEA